jgi:hypothetical protein
MILIINPFNNSVITTINLNRSVLKHIPVHTYSNELTIDTTKLTKSLIPYASTYCTLESMKEIRTYKLPEYDSIKLPENTLLNRLIKST